MFCNNDLIFKQGSISRLIAAFKTNPLLMSASSQIPGDKSTENQSGYHVGIKGQFYGWFFMMRRTAYEEIGGLDEDVTAWFSDDCVAQQLKQKNLLHMLISGSYVEHLENQTINYGTNQEKKDFVSGQDIFEKKYGKKIW